MKVYRKLRSALRVMGLSSLIGMGLISASAAVLIAEIIPLKSQIAHEAKRLKRAGERYRQANLTLATRARQTAGNPPGPKTVVPERAEAFITDLATQAARAHVQLAEVEYQTHVVEPGRARLQATAKIEGQYSQIKAFLNALLDKNPGVALEKISLQKSSTPDFEILCEARFSTGVSAQ